MDIIIAFLAGLSVLPLSIALVNATVFAKTTGLKKGKSKARWLIIFPLVFVYELFAVISLRKK